jgi:hypothetical protein
MKFKKEKVKIVVFLITILLSISSLISIFYLLFNMEKDMKIKSEPFEYPKEDTMKPQPLVK